METCRIVKNKNTNEILFSSHKRTGTQVKAKRIIERLGKNKKEYVIEHFIPQFNIEKPTYIYDL